MLTNGDMDYKGKHQVNHHRTTERACQPKVVLINLI